MNRTMANADNPRLSAREARKQPLGSRKRVLRHLKLPSLNVNSNDFAFVAVLYLSTDLALVNLPTSPRMLFLRVTWSGGLHTGISSNGTRLHLAQHYTLKVRWPPIPASAGHQRIVTSRPPANRVEPWELPPPGAPKEPDK